MAARKQFPGSMNWLLKRPHTTCANDLALLSTNEFEMISMVSTVEDYSNKNIQEKPY